MDLFKKDPHNTYVLINLITTNLILKDSPILKRIYIYHRRDIQRFIWEKGIEHYLKPKGLNLTAELLLHSLQKNPQNIIWDDGSEAAKRIKKAKKFQDEIRGLIQKNTPYYLARSRFYGDISFSITSDDNDDDLYLSLGTMSVKCHANYEQDKGWVFKCIAIDTYDFDKFRRIPFEKIFTDGLKAIVGETANNAGLFSQYDGVINNYGISITFSYEYKG